MFPLTVAPVTVTGYAGVPVLVTVNASGGAVVADNASLSVMVIVVPAAFVTADDQVGAF